MAGICEFGETDYVPSVPLGPLGQEADQALLDVLRLFRFDGLEEQKSGLLILGIDCEGF